MNYLVYLANHIPDLFVSLIHTTTKTTNTHSHTHLLVCRVGC